MVRGLEKEESVMGELRERFQRHMRLKGLADKTRDSYERALLDLTREYKVAPDTLSNGQIQAHLDHLLQKKHLAWATMNVRVSALRLFYGEILKRPVAEFSLPPRGRSKKRPVVLSRDTVRRILETPASLKHRALLTLVYGSGLRVSEVVRLKPRHIESSPERMMVRVEQGKGRKDRYTLLSRRSLKLLRDYWRKYQPTDWLFFGFDRSKPMSIGTAQMIYKKAYKKAGQNNLHGIHGLRHAFATHLLEQGTDLLVIKRCLGHSALSTTAQYCHLSAAHFRNVRSPADTLFEKV